MKPWAIQSWIHVQFRNEPLSVSRKIDQYKCCPPSRLSQVLKPTCICCFIKLGVSFRVSFQGAWPGGANGTNLDDAWKGFISLAHLWELSINQNGFDLLDNKYQVVLLCEEITYTWYAYLSSYPEYFQELHWFSMGLQEISRARAPLIPRSPIDFQWGSQKYPGYPGYFWDPMENQWGSQKYPG